MSKAPDPNTLETDRLILRPQRVGDAAVFHQLWTERDARVPPHRQIGPDGRPTEADIVSHIREQQGDSGMSLLTVERKGAAVIGYCGLVFNGNGEADEPELAFELLRDFHNHGYATEAAWAVISRAADFGYPRLWATVWDWNVSSRRVLEKLGFRDTGRVNADSMHGRSLLTVRDS